jgi:peptidoglycan/LPS O-acetylase OafA/YrhL
MDYLNLIIDPRKIEQFWYLNALFFVSALYAVIKWYAKYTPWQQLLLGLFFFVAGDYVHANHINVGFLEDVFFFYFFFAIGDFIAGFFMNPKNDKILSSFSTTMVLLPVFVIIQHYFTLVNLSHKDDYYVQYQMPVLYVLAALVGGAFILNISFWLQKLNTLRFLRVVGYHSLYIYAMHLIITAATRAVLINIFHIKYIPVMIPICIATGVIIPIIFFNVMESLGASWLFSIKKKSNVKEERARLFFDKNIIVSKEGVPVKR